MSYQIRFTPEARDDLLRLYRFLLEKDLTLAERARDATVKAIAMLSEFPFSCRKVNADNSCLRELIVPFGQSGYVALFEIEDDHSVRVLAIRHQREDDYH